MKADVLALVSTLSMGLADATLADRYYTDIIRLLGQREWLTQATLLPVTGGTASYSLPDIAVRLLAVFYDDRLLPQSSILEMQAVDPHWRDRLGTPIVHVVEDETTGDFVLYPIPAFNSKDFIFIFGAPFGLDYPEYAVAIIHTETREDVPAYMELPIALAVCAREFERESDHRDAIFAVACRKLSDLLFGLIEGTAPGIVKSAA